MWMILHVYLHLHVHACMSVYRSCQCLSVMAECLWRLKRPSGLRHVWLIHLTDMRSSRTITSPPASQTLTQADRQGPAGTTCYWCLESGVWDVHSKTHIIFQAHLSLTFTLWLLTKVNRHLHHTSFFPLFWQGNTSYELINREQKVKVHLVRRVANLTYGGQTERKLIFINQWAFHTAIMKRTSCGWLTNIWRMTQQKYTSACIQSEG